MTGNVRARYAYDPFGQRTKLMGDLETDFGFAGMLWVGEAGLNLTRFRAYDPNLGRWLSRDPLKDAEVEEGYNLYSYVHNNTVNFTDPLGLELCCWSEFEDLMGNVWNYFKAGAAVILNLLLGWIVYKFRRSSFMDWFLTQEFIGSVFSSGLIGSVSEYWSSIIPLLISEFSLATCLIKPCPPPPCAVAPGT